jgi:hypothetical protein
MYIHAYPYQPLKERQETNHMESQTIKFNNISTTTARNLYK